MKVARGLKGTGLRELARVFKRNGAARDTRGPAPMKYLSKILLLSDDKEVYGLGLGFIDLTI